MKDDPRWLTRREIALIYDVPPWLLGVEQPGDRLWWRRVWLLRMWRRSWPGQTLRRMVIGWWLR